MYVNMKNIVSLNNAIIFFLLFILNLVNCGRVLVIAPSPSFSHQIVFRGLTEVLLKRGHEVVFITAIPLNDPSLSNYTEIDASFAYKVLHKTDSKSVITGYNKLTKYEIDKELYKMQDVLTDLFFNDPEVKKLYKGDSNEKFDVVIVEGLMSLGMYSIAHILNAPLIGLITTDLHMYHNFYLGAPLLPSHPSNWEFFYRVYPGISFWDRVQNFVLAMFTVFHWYNYQTVKHEKVMRNMLERDVPPLYEVARTTSLFLVNHDVAVGYARPVPPNVIFFSGLHITEKPPPLPKDMSEFLGNATKGFVYMSLGCNMKSDILPSNIQETIHNTFLKLPYKVLWKYESDNIPKSSKIFTSKWIPQQSVLAHPNIKAFIFQGGQQSTEETIHYGVPIIGVPIMFEQTYRIRKLAELEVGRMLELNQINEETLSEAIVDVMQNESYKRNMIKLNELVKDKPQSSKDNVVWWIEFVMRHKGAAHLRCIVPDEPWYQQYDMDVIAFISIILFIVILISTRVLVRASRWMYQNRHVLSQIRQYLPLTQERQKIE